MIADIYDYFDNYKNCVHGLHVYCNGDKIALSFSPRSFAEKNYIHHILKKFVETIKTKLTHNVTLEINVNKFTDIKNIKVTHKSDPDKIFHKEPDFDYMPETMD